MLAAAAIGWIFALAAPVTGSRSDETLIVYIVLGLPVWGPVTFAFGVWLTNARFARSIERLRAGAAKAQRSGIAVSKPGTPNWSPGTSRRRSHQKEPDAPGGSLAAKRTHSDCI
jgi:hypothetical protein